MLAAAIALAACDANQPLKVKDPDVATPGSASGFAALPYLRAGVLADFAVAFVGAGDQSNNGHEGIANLGGLMTDELTDYDTYTTRNSLNYRLAIPNNLNVANVFRNLGAVHSDAVYAYSQYQQFAPDSIGAAEVENIDGYVYILVAEHFCSGEPFSSINVGTGAVQNSPFLTTTQMFDTALARFALAGQIAAKAQDPTQAGLALIGTARAQLDLGQIAAAATTAAQIPAGYSYQVFESNNTQRQSNGVWQYNINFQGFSVADQKNTMGLPFATGGDPRVPATLSAQPGSNGGGPFYNTGKYAAASTPMTLGDATEAQLIVAEGDIAAGDYAAGKAIMDNLRSTVGLAPLAAAATPKAQMQQLLTERAYWMWVTGHRLGDWRRVLRPPYNQAPFSFVAGDVYPFGTSEFGPVISTSLEFPTPLYTNANPNYKACDPTIP